MLTNKKYIFVLLFLFLISCGAYDTSENDDYDNQGGDSPATGQEKAANFTKKLVFANTESLEYFLNTSYHAAKDAKIELELRESGFFVNNIFKHGLLNTYMGLLNISFTEGFSDGSKKDRNFEFTTGRDQLKTQYNHLYIDKNTDKFVWKGFFQDENNKYGSLLVILTEGESVTDDLSSDDGIKTQVLFSLANGYVYGRMWNNDANHTRGPLSGKKCWQLYAGPYDCRSWKAKSGRPMDITKSLFPDGTEKIGRPRGTGKRVTDYGKYERLGRFSNVNLDILFALSPINSVTKKINKSRYLTALTAKKNKKLRSLASTYKSQNLSFFPKLLLVVLAISFIALTAFVFIKPKKPLK